MRDEEWAILDSRFERAVLGEKKQLNPFELHEL